MTALGNYRHRVTIQAPRASRTAQGNPKRDWYALIDAWVSIKPLTGSELISAQAGEARITHDIRMRFVDGIAPKMRILYDGRVLEIDSVSDVMERRRELSILAREVTS